MSSQKKEKNYRPPFLPKFLLQIFVRSESRNYAVGDFIEIYNQVCNKYGRLNGYVWFWYQTIKSFFPFIFHSIYWGGVMFRNYFKVTIRGFLRNKVYTLINILGLSVGLACCILIMLWVQNELSYESFVKNRDNIYRVVCDIDFAGQTNALARTPVSLAPALKNEFPEIIKSTRYRPADISLTLNENEFKDLGALIDPDFIKMFPVKIIKGNPNSLFNGPFDLILSESISKKIFGSENSVGKTLKLDNEIPMNITGVFQDFPENSHMKFSALGTFELMFQMGFPREIWANFNNPIYSYVEVEKNTNINLINKKIENILSRHDESVKGNISLQSLNDVHLYSNFRGDVSGHGNIEYVYVAVIMGVFLLLIACFNFMNLSTAKASGRAKEIGMRKVIGAFRKDVISQFIGEAFLLTIAAFLAALLIVYLALPEFNALTSKSLTMNFLDNPLLLWGSIGILFITAVFAGSYPAFLLSAFQPASVLKSQFVSNLSGAAFRKILVIIQFSLSIAVTIGMMIVYSQIDFIGSKWLGFDKEHLLYMETGEDMSAGIEAFKTEAAKYPDIINVSVASHLLADVTHVMGNVEWEGKDPSSEFNMNCLLVDENFVKTLGMKIKDGEDFYGKPVEEGIKSVIINETALGKMNLDDPIGKNIKWGGHEGVIVGIVEDFHFKPMQSQVEPMLMVKSGEEPFVMYIKINSGNMDKTISSIGELWKTHFPEEDFYPQFVDQAIEKMYENEKKVQSMFEYFAVLTVLISCLGLFGLASYMAEKRTKEIGIRKTLGASVPNVIYMLSKEFTLWVVAANILAWPAAYFFMENWLEGFAYRINISPLLFFITGLGALLITWATVGFQTIKAALANPVDSLKNE